MSEAKGTTEPSMEEILASIRRIIAEDAEPEPAEAPPSQQAEAPPAAVAPVDDVLDLTEVVDESPVEPVAPEPPPPPSPPPPPPPEPEPVEAEPVADFRTMFDEDRLVSEATAASSTASFAAIAGRAQRRLGGEVFIGNGALTLEEIVRELLRPMLREWLDAHLPGLVERLVREEIERLARDAM